jgi:copper oxidase (laccase) domain-containing protein
LNLWKANEIILTEAGVAKENIAITNVCTNCNPEVLFSHRASKGQRGALAAFLALR